MLPASIPRGRNNFVPLISAFLRCAHSGCGQLPNTSSLLLFDTKMFYLTLEAGLYMTWTIEVKQSGQKDGSTTSGTGPRYIFDDLDGIIGKPRMNTDGADGAIARSQPSTINRNASLLPRGIEAKFSTLHEVRETTPKQYGYASDCGINGCIFVSI